MVLRNIIDTSLRLRQAELYYYTYYIIIHVTGINQYSKG